MAVTPEDVVERVGAKGPDALPRATKALERATTLLGDALEDAFREVPEHVYDECLESVAYAVYDRRKSSDGTRSATTMEGQLPVRTPRDPLASVRSILANYVLGAV